MWAGVVDVPASGAGASSLSAVRVECTQDKFRRSLCFTPVWPDVVDVPIGGTSASSFSSVLRVQNENESGRLEQFAVFNMGYTVLFSFSAKHNYKAMRTLLYHVLCAQLQYTKDFT